jgi:hypothetical protein
VCLGCTNDVSIITTSVVVLIVDHTRVVTICYAIDELNPSLLTPLKYCAKNNYMSPNILNDFMGIIKKNWFIHYFLIFFCMNFKS